VSLRPLTTRGDGSAGADAPADAIVGRMTRVLRRVGRGRRLVRRLARLLTPAREA
jgi:hypothetical protein